MSDCSDTPKEQKRRAGKDPAKSQTNIGKGTNYGKKDPGAGGGQKRKKGK